MASIGAHLLPRNAAAKKESAAEEQLQPKAGPSIGPMISPAETQTQVQVPPAIITGPTVPVVPRYEEEEDDEDEDVYAPELPPDLAAARANPTSVAVPPPRRPIGPPRGPLQREEEEEESEDEIGPAPPPGIGLSSSSRVNEDAVIEFMQKEAQRRQAIEEAARPKTLKRDEWMLVPPSSSGLLSKLDPTKLNKPRQFSRSTATPKVVDNTLWTETPAEKQQRLADEVMGKKRRVENADPDQEGDEEEATDGVKRRKREAELQRQVDEYTRSHRGPSLVDARTQEEGKRKKDAQEESAAIWDHTRDMSVGGRLMDEKDRRRVIQDAKGLSDRFGAGKGGSFL